MRSLFAQRVARAVLLVVLATSLGARAAEVSANNRRHFNIVDYGAKGDGIRLETGSINKTIEACSVAGGGEVLIPAGKFLSGTIHLRSHVAFHLEAGARIIGTTNLSAYSAPNVPAFLPEAKWGKWHRALIVGEGLEDVSISGEGTIDGNKVFDPTGEEKMRGPHTIAFVNCRDFRIRDVSILDSANYAIFFQVSDHVDVRNVTITGGWDGVHFRGAPEHPCREVSITSCRFSTGDDSIAGRYWDNTLIADCFINSSCNGIRLIGPATHLTINHCLFSGPGAQPHRSSHRTNMLSGIILQPGAWDKTEGLLDDVLIANNTMKAVASPVTIWTRGDNPVGRISIAGLTATGVYRSALSIESWAEGPITNVVVRNATVEFEGGGTAEQAKREVKGPGVDARPLPSWAVYARNVEHLTLEDVRFSFRQKDQRPVILTEGVRDFVTDAVKFPHLDSVVSPIIQKEMAASR